MDFYTVLGKRRTGKNGLQFHLIGDLRRCRTDCRRPLAFLAQFNCAEIALLDRESLLPGTGLLSFFYELDSQCWGFDPKDKGCAGHDALFQEICGGWERRRKIFQSSLVGRTSFKTI